MKTFLPAALAALAACQAPGAPRATAPRDEHSHAEPWRTRVTHVDLDLALDFDAKRIAGTARLRLERLEPGAPLVLDSQGLDVEEVLGGDGSPRRFELGAEHGGLGGPLTIELEDADESVTIRYRTEPGAEALQWLTPEQTAGGRSPFLFSQGESVLTRTWIPLQDTPGVRITYTARIRAPRDLVPVMSAEETERRGDGLSFFRMTRPIPPYLIALACGDLAFQAISDRCGVWADPTIVEQAAAELEDTERMIASAENLFGPYRWGRYDILILPPAFPFGGMENPCLTFATPTMLAGDKSLVSLVAHELAHSWSGNLVTNATWRDFWLNEGFTVYFESRIMEAVYGRERAQMEVALFHEGLVRAMRDMAPEDTVLHIDLSGRHPDEGFSSVPYYKGAAFLRRLEQVFGRPALDRFLRAWFDGHAFQSVTTDDFLEFLDEKLLKTDPKLAAQVDVDRWIHEPGLPDTAPVQPSRALADVDRELEAFLSGRKRADELATEGWVTQQWQHFLEGLPEDTSPETMAELDRAFGFTRSGNSEVLCVWLQRAVRHGYAAADDRLEQFLMNVGRAKFLKPLYTELAKRDPERARELYARARPRYHAVARSGLDPLVGWTPH